MSVASMRNGTMRRITALTTESLEGCSRHAAFGASGVEIVAAVMKLLPVDDGTLWRHQGSEQRIPGPVRTQ